MSTCNRYRRVLAAALCLGLLGPAAHARIVSINIAYAATGNTAIEGPETFGVPALGTVAGNWNNLSGSVPLVRDDGSSSTASVSVASPGGFNYFGAVYVNTPLNYGLQHYAATPEGSGLTLRNLQQEFPGGYYVIVYLTGFANNTGASVSDGTTTYYYQTASPLPATFGPDSLVQATLTSPPEAGAAPVAHYALFGSPDNPLTADEATFTIDHLGGGGAGFGGLQLVAVGDTGGGGGGGEDPEWTDPALGTYFLDADSGSDANDGKSPATAWQTLGRLNSVFFKPGDVVLFKAGTVFTGSFFVLDSGTPESPIVFGAYGKGPKPRLQGGAGDREVIFVEGAGGLEFRDLEISNYHPTGSIADRFGIRIYAPPAAGEMRDLHFHGLDMVWIKGSGEEHESRGIDADTGTNDDIKPYTRWNGFVIENCYFANIDGRAVQLTDRCQSLSDKRLRGLDYYPTVGFVFQNNVGQDIYRNLLQIAGTKDALIQHNYMEGTTHGSAFWPFDAEGTVVQFNDFRHLRNPEADSFICHFDYNCVGTLMQYNFGYDVDGGLIEIIVLSDFEFFQEDAVARYNIGVDVGFRNKENAAGIMFSGRVTRSQVYNNTIVFTDRQSAYKAIAVNNWGDEWPDNNFIHNNLFLATGSPVTFNDDFRLGQLGNVVSHNLYHGNLPVPAVDLAPVTGDPKLANPGGLEPADYKLLAGSAAIGSGTPIAGNGGRDFFDNPLAAVAVPSIGAHEFLAEGAGRWAGFRIGDTGYVDTGSGFLGWLWVGADGTGVGNWMYSVAAGQWVYCPENYVAPRSGAWFYLYNSAALLPTDIRGEWFFSQALGTWVASYGAAVGSGSAWIYALDLSPQPQLARAFHEENRRRREMKARGEIFYGPLQFRQDVWEKVYFSQLRRALQRQAAADNDQQISLNTPAT